jgi:hypothetical protein
MCKQGTTVPMPICGRVYDIDSCIAHLVAALNAGGVPTRASCCGHGKLPGSIVLDDGRELFVIPDFKMARRLEQRLALRRGGAL